MSNFEKKFGKYAIKNLSLILIIFYAAGYLLSMLAPKMLDFLYLDPYKIIHEFQIWRILTWLIVPPGKFDFWTIITLYFYYSIGTSLEMTWGRYRYNIYIFSGIIFTLVAAFVLYFIGVPEVGLCIMPGGTLTTAWAGCVMFSTYYVNMSIFLAFAATFPNNYVYLFFLLPIKVAFLGIVYGAFLIYDVFTYVKGFVDTSDAGYIAYGVVIVASLLNFVVFFIMQKKRIHKGSNFQAQFRKRMEAERVKRNDSSSGFEKPKQNVTKHKCSVCGKTDETDPEMTFRFCSKCDGNYEYCQDHLFTHRHVGDRWN